MTRVQGWIVIALLAVLAANFLMIDFVMVNMMSGFAETFPSDLPTDFPTELESGPVPTGECDIDPSKCE